MDNLFVVSNLVRWDGKCGKFQYETDQIEYWDMKVDDGGTIWYRTYETPRQWSIWCPAEKLRSHLRHLEQVKAR